MGKGKEEKIKELPQAEVMSFLRQGSSYCKVVWDKDLESSKAGFPCGFGCKSGPPHQAEISLSLLQWCWRHLGTWEDITGSFIPRRHWLHSL